MGPVERENDMYQMGAPAWRVRPLLAHGTQQCRQSNIYLAEPKFGYTVPKRSRTLYLSLSIVFGISRPLTQILASEEILKERLDLLEGFFSGSS